MSPELGFEAKFQMEQIRLKRIRYLRELYLSRIFILENPRGADYSMDNIRHTFACELAGLPAVQQVRYPSDWWEHFRQRWFPGWALRRWPVKMTTVEVKAAALFPNLALPPSREDLIVEFVCEEPVLVRP